MARPQTKEDLIVAAEGNYDKLYGSTIGSYFTSVTSSHYEWAMNKIKAHRKRINGK